MPVYEYECTECGNQIEIMQKFSDPPIAECDRCHGKMKKLISQCTFHLKGTGWYVTDYASKSSTGTGEKHSKGSNGGAADTKTRNKTEKPKESSSKKETSTP